MKKHLEPTPLVLPMPALLVGTYSQDGTPNAMTAAWTAACCHEPPSVGVAVRKSRLTYENIQARGAFTLNIPTSAQAMAVDYLGIVSGRSHKDKLAVAGMEAVRAEKVDAPIIASCPVNVECRLHSQLEIGSHVWIVGEVLLVQADSRVIDPDGSLDLAAIDPLGYASATHTYHALGRELGAAFSIGKQLKIKN